MLYFFVAENMEQYQTQYYEKYIVLRHFIDRNIHISLTRNKNTITEWRHNLHPCSLIIDILINTVCVNMFTGYKLMLLTDVKRLGKMAIHFEIHKKFRFDM